MPTRRFNRHKKRWSWLRRAQKGRLLRFGLAGVGALFLISALTILWWSRDLPDPQNISARAALESTKIFDSTGTHLLYEIGEIHRTHVSLDNMSPFIVAATLAAEDDQFYEHHGLDFTGIARGVILKPLSGRRAQGGSTITQQLIKNAILTPERTVQRKVKEAVLALELEQRFSKDQILAMYLNNIPYGSLAYGVEAASRKFYGISAQDVTLAQAAILASLPQAPSYYSPHGSHFEDLKARQEHILDRMAALNMITPDQAGQAKKEPLDFAPPRESIQAPHFVFYVKELLEKEFGERVVEQGGLHVTTTIDMRLQSIAEDVLQANQERLRGLGASNAALVAVDPKTGNILAMAGSIDYFNEDIDGNVNVSIRHRSPGSSIKPFVYAAAFAKGFTSDTILVDAETDFGQGYKPRNYNLSQNGPVTMRQALANSLNIPAVKTLYLAGVRNATDLAQKMGMESLNDPDRYGLSLVLGGGEVRLLDEVAAYGVFANDGLRVPHRAILQVAGGGETLVDTTQEEPSGEQVLDPQVSRLVTNILSDNGARALVFGTNTPLHLGSRPVAAKTGTTQEFRDGWTAGFTPSLAAGVWVGNNDNSPMNQKSDSGLTAAPLWNTFMRRALEGTPIEQFVRPEPIRNVPHGVLQGEIPEVKVKWVPEANIAYTLDCPVAVGQERTFKELHSILFYIRAANPLGPPPANADSDPQFNNWEAAVAAWRDKYNAEHKDTPADPVYGAGLPTPACDIGDPEDLPKVTITEPATTIVKASPVTVRVEVESRDPLREVRFLVEGQEIGRRGPDEDFVAAFTYPDGFSGRMSLQVLAISEKNFIGQAHRTFIINPDDSPPAITLHTPQDGLSLSPTDFPFTVKTTATDASGVDYVDMLYHKEDDSGNKRINRSSTVAPTAPNRYEVVWDDSPGPGTYEVFAIVYDKTGNFTESGRHTIIIE